MRARAVARIAASLTAATLLTSCTQETTGSAAGETPDPTTNPAPQVTQPLDVTPFLDNPCELVDPNILAEFGDFEAGEPDIDSDLVRNLTGPTCNWDWKGTGAAASVTIQTVHQEISQDGYKGIDGIYAKGEGEYQPVDIPGHTDYPAAFSGGGQSSCPLYVGIANDLTVVTSGRDLLDDIPDLCAVSIALATSVLDTLKKAAN